MNFLSKIDLEVGCGRKMKMKAWGAVIVKSHSSFSNHNYFTASRNGFKLRPIFKTSS